MYTYSISEARAKLAEVIKASRTHVVQITDRNRPTAAVIDWDEYEAMVETMELLSNQEELKWIREGMADIEAGRVTDLDDVKKKYGR